ncbi:MAG: hypothetical protein ACKO5J_03825 [Rubrivivax sp.]
MAFEPLPGHPGHPGQPRPERPRRAREWALAVVLALAGHAVLLGGLQPAAFGDLPARPAHEAPALAVLVVRTLVEPPHPVEAREARETALPAPPGEPAPSSLANPRSVQSAPSTPGAQRPPGIEGIQGSQGTHTSTNTPATAATPNTPTTPTTPPTTRPPDSPAEALRTAPEGLAAGDEAPGPGATEAYAGAPPPVWATRVPGDFAARYRVQRGDDPPRLATLRFEVAQGRYALQLEGAAGGRGLEQASQGRLDAAGLAPERYLDRRRARAAAAANFDRARSRISYSGAPLEQPLFAGTQDRLSWIVQLAAIVEAEPARWAEGARLPLYVSGARGDAQLWLFSVRGRTMLEAPGSPPREALHLVREPERPYDVRVEAWLDPARQHLPARLLLSPVPAGRPVLWSAAP